MKKKLLYISTLLLISSCQAQEKKDLNVESQIIEKTSQSMEETIDLEKIKKHIELQVNVTCDDVFDPREEYTPTKDDLDLMLPLLEKSLINNGYKMPDYSLFKQKIQEGFGINIDDSNENILVLNCYDIYGYNNELYYDLYNFCIPNLFIDKKRRIITPMIFLSDIIKINNSKVNDYSIKQNLPILSLNKYLFYSDKTSITLLIQKEPELASDLLVCFGYDKSDRLNNLVIDETYHGNIEEFLSNVVFFKNRDGQLKIRYGALESLKNRYLKNKTIENIFPLKSFSSLVILDQENKYTQKEQMMIIAYLANIYDPIYKNDRYSTDWNWGLINILSDYLYSIGEKEWKNVKEEYAKNNYYNLPYLKDMVDYAEQFDKGGPPDNY
ncbi:hypothetical protein ETU09_09575 [Apibacter muscae]|uniref:Lipoprotein n=1 Tax=Apibacter muscae TaxID=2509004 RepID=A0A563D9C0_9FLAO|nr:hypothetical protein [Apibacter muscae]TWP26800.1 hypothetical protein ETU09_09575 [Apibacter muscae]